MIKTYTVMMLGLVLLTGCVRRKSSDSNLERLDNECREALCRWDYLTSDSLAGELLQLASERSDRYHEAVALYYLGDFRPDLEDSKLDERERILSEAENAAREMADTLLLARICNTKGIWEITRRRNFEMAQYYFSTAIKFGQKAGDRMVEASAAANYSELCRFLGDTIGLSHDDEIFRYSMRTDNHALQIASAFQCCRDLIKRGTSEKELRQYTDLIADKDSADNMVELIYALYFLEEGDYPKAEEWIMKTPGDKAHMHALVYARILNKLGRYEQSNHWAKHVMDVYRDQNFDDGWIEIYKLMASNYSGLGDSGKAYEYQVRYADLTDSLSRIRNNSRIERLKVEYGVERKDMEIRMQKSRIRSLWVISGSLMLTIVLGSAAYALYHKKRNRLYEEIVRQNLESLHREKMLIERVAQLEKSCDDSASPGRPEEGKRGIADERVNEIFDKIRNYAEKKEIWRDRTVTRESFADMVGCNRTYFSEVVKIKTGMSYTQYMNTFRIKEAVRMLSSSSQDFMDMSLKEISEAVGFNSDSNFYSTFRQTVGLSPAAYRKTVLKLR